MTRRRMSSPVPALAIAIAIACATPLANAAAPETTPPPVRFEVNARLRVEEVDDDAFARNADATTLRIRAGMRWTLGDAFTALVEGEGIINAGDGYNSGANGQVTYPSIADPEGAELNQAWLAWKHERAGATIGRQRLVFDNQRWIGNSGWRQNEQTFDAAAIEVTPREHLIVRYAWLDRVHRVNGDGALDRLARERSLDTHLLNVAWKRGAHQLVGYAWLHEDRDVAAASSATYGMRSVTTHVVGGRGWGVTLEAATQHGHAASPGFSHRYWLVEPALTRRGVTWRAGWEHLGGDGTHALQTPLATLHAFNGWADRFTTTPAGGLEDRYVGAAGKFGDARFQWQVAWHDYRADSGGDNRGHYGQEWNAALGFPVRGRVKGLVKLADYRADGFARDTTKAWVQLEWTR